MITDDKMEAQGHRSPTSPARLVFLVKLFQYILRQRVAIWIRFTLNLEFKFSVLANCVTLLLVVAGPF